jgi:hypothetical protein
MDHFKRKHISNDLTIFEDFRTFLMGLDDSDSNSLLEIWKQFPNATWTRACGFMVEDLVLYEKKYNLARLFWEHDMFRMGGRYRAEELMTHFLQ